jgi:mRNA interferase MazF
VICDPWAVVVVPFPFTDTGGAKRRPAVVLSETEFNRHGHSVLVMITSSTHAQWPGDVEIRDLDAAGLKVSCIVRLKIFTLDNRLLLRRIGGLAEDDRERLVGEVRGALAGL